MPHLAHNRSSGSFAREGSDVIVPRGTVQETGLGGGCPVPLLLGSMVRILLLGFLAILIGCTSDTSSPTLKVGMDLSYPPFETIDEQGKPMGVSVDLANALGEYLGRPVRIENMAFAGLIPSLQSGRIDCVISSMTETEERRQSVAFSDPYLTIGLALLVRKDSPLQKPGDLFQGHPVVAVCQGTTGEIWVRKNLPHARVLAVEKENAAVLEVLQGRVDAFIYDQMSVWQNARKHEKHLRPVLEPLQTEKWAVALRKDDEVLRKEVNAFLEDFRNKGGFDRLRDKYLRDQKEAFDREGVPFYF